MSKITLKEISLITIEWFAVDSKGNVAVFVDGGTAFVPEYVFENKERTEKLLELFETLPKISDENIRDEYVRNWLEKGVFVYNAEQKTNAFSELYEQSAKPNRALNYRRLSKDIKTLLGNIDIDEPGIGGRKNLWFRDIEDFNEAPQIRVPNEYQLDDRELMSIPEYIRDHTGYTSTYRTSTTAYLRCRCGCESFDVYKNALNDEEKKIKELYDAAVKEELGSWRSVYAETDEAGIVHWYKKRFLFGRREVFPPEEPDFLKVELYKAKCIECGREILLFDNRFIGQNSIAEGEDIENYVPTMKDIVHHADVRITYEIDEEDSPEEFSEITIAAVENGKYKKLLEYEM